MANDKNKFGLSKSIPAGIKRKVRQRDGFGCVICGFGLIEYEHVDPTFANAKDHEVDNITLLCAQCHSRATRRAWSKEKVKLAMKNPICKSQGFSHDFFDIGHEQPEIKIAGVHLENCMIPLMINQLPLIQFDLPEERNGPFLLTAHFCDSDGKLALTIDKNEWRSNSSVWDFEVTGRQLSIRKKSKQICLRIKSEPPNCLIIEKIDMQLFGYIIQGNQNGLKVRIPGGRNMDVSNSFVSNSLVGFSF